jgi:hypothetical protein
VQTSFQHENYIKNNLNINVQLTLPEKYSIYELLAAPQSEGMEMYNRKSRYTVSENIK